MTTGSNLRSTLTGMDKTSLNKYKASLRERVKRMTPDQQERFYSYAKGIPELSDIVTPSTSQLKQSSAVANTGTSTSKKPWEEFTPDLNLWQKGLKAFNLPFDVVGRYVTEPFATVVSSPFTKSVPGTEGMSWYDRERAEYEKGVPGWGKFALESLPWLAIPGAGTVGGVAKAGGAISKASGVAGALGKLGKAGKVAGTAIEYSPWGLTEKATGAVLKGAGKALGIKPKVPPMPKAIAPEVDKLTKLIKDFKPVEGETRALQHQFKQQQAAKIGGILEKYSQDPNTAYRMARGVLKGTLPKTTTPSFEAMTSQEIVNLKNMITNYEPWKLKPFNKLNTEIALSDLLTGTLPTKYDNELLESVFGSEMVKALMSKRSLGQKTFDNVMSIVGVPKALVASFDLSAPARQGVLLMSEKSWWKAWKPMMQALVKDENAIAINEAIFNHPLAKYAETAKLYLTPFRKVSAGLEKSEEAFMSRLTEKIPWVKASERAYVTYLNKLRSDTFNSYVSRWLKEGVPEEEILTRSVKIADFINKATGRGNLLGIERSGQAQQILNAAFFSPRFVASRVQIPFTVFTKNKEARKMMAKNLVTFFGGSMAALTLIKASGAADVELDPTSTDFGKVRIGNTRIDFWGGFQPLARYTAQFLAESRKTASGGRMEVNRLETGGRFIESKLSPTAGLILSSLRGTNMIGEPVGGEAEDVGRTAINMLTPMFIQDMIDASMEEGLLGTGIGLLSGVGSSVNTYPVNDPLNNAAKLKYGKQYAELSPGQRGQIRNDPSVRSKVKPTEAEKASYKFYDEQSDDDLAFQEGKLSGSQWRERMSLRQAQRAWSRKKFEGTYPEPKTPEDVVLQQYYSIFESLGDNPMPDEMATAMNMAESYVSQLPPYLQAYIEENRYPDATPMIQEWKKVQRTLKPYWNITNQVWSQYEPELKQLSDKIEILETQDPMAAKRELMKYPKIVYARRMIAMQKKLLKQRQPLIAEYLRTYYS